MRNPCKDIELLDSLRLSVSDTKFSNTGTTLTSNDIIPIGQHVYIDSYEGWSGEGIVVAHRKTDSCRHKVRLCENDELLWVFDGEIHPKPVAIDKTLKYLFYDI